MIVGQVYVPIIITHIPQASNSLCKIMLYLFNSIYETFCMKGPHGRAVF